MTGGKEREANTQNYNKKKIILKQKMVFLVASKRKQNKSMLTLFRFLNLSGRKSPKRHHLIHDS